MWALAGFAPPTYVMGQLRLVTVSFWSRSFKNMAFETMAGNSNVSEDVLLAFFRRTGA